MSRRLALIAPLLLAGACGLFMDDEARLERARVAFADQAWEAAIIDLKVLLQKAPDDAATRALLGRALTATGDYEAAEKELQAALDLGHPVDDMRLELAETWIATGQPGRALDVADPDAAEYEEDAFRLRLLRGDALAGLDERLGALREYDQADRMGVDTGGALLRAAEIHWADEGYEDAAFLAELALARAPNDAEARLTLGAVHLDAGDPMTAASVLLPLLAMSPMDADTLPWALAYLIQARLEAGDAAGAGSLFEQVTTIWSADEPELQLVQARVTLANGDYVAAAQAAQEYLASDPESEIALRLLGTAQLRRGFLNQAETTLQAALRRDEDRADTHRLLAETYLALGDTAEAREYLEWTFLLAPADAWAAAMLGAVDNLGDGPVRQRLLAGDPAGALQAATDGAAATPEDATALHALGLAQLAAGLAAEGVESLRRAAAMRAPDEAPRLDLARGLIAAGTPLAALTLLDAAAADDVSEQHYLVARTALAHALESDSGEAGERLRQARAWLQSDPEDIEVRLLLARALLEAGDCAAAAAEYETLLELDYLSEDVYNNAAWCYLRLGDPRARRLAETAASIAPEDGAVLDTLGWLMAGSGETEAAVSLLRDAALLRPGDPEIGYHLARALTETGDYEAAMSTLRRFSDTGRSTPEMRSLWDELSQNQ